MGSVYQATDLQLGSTVALKVIPIGESHAILTRARFTREAQIGAQLGRTRGFVRALDHNECGSTGLLYLAMDWVDGARLDLTTGPVEQRVELVAAAAALVAQAHALGVIHRDVKPQNFLVTPAGELLLADFGLSKLTTDATDAREDLGHSLTGSGNAGDLTRTGVCFGTPLYMAPEQFVDAGRVGEQADVYSLGVMLYLALTGEFPYAGRTPGEIQRAQCMVEFGRAPAPRPSHRDSSIGAELDGLVASALAVKPAERVGSARDFLERLAAARTPTPTPAASDDSPDLEEPAPERPHQQNCVASSVEWQDDSPRGFHDSSVLAALAGMGLVALTAFFIPLSQDSPPRHTPEPMPAIPTSREPVKERPRPRRSATDHPPCSLTAGHRLLEQGDHNGAIAAYGRAITNEPRSAPAYAGRSRAYSRAGALRSALADSAHALSLAPDLPLALEVRAQLECTLAAAQAEADHDLQRAISDYARALELDPGNALLHYSRGRVHFCLDNLSDALSDYDEAIRIDPDFPLAHVNRGMALLRLGRFEEAAQSLDDALALEPGASWVPQVQEARERARRGISGRGN